MIARRVVFLVYVLVIFEVVSLLALAYMERSGFVTYRPVGDRVLSDGQRSVLESAFTTDTYIQHDPVLGWSIRPGASGPSKSATMAGIRRNVPGPDMAAATLRVGTFGDSFVHGDEVGDAATWQSQLEQLDSRLDVPNYGVPGYGIDQALLRYRRAEAAQHMDVVVIGFMTENVARSVNTFRPYYRPMTDIPFSKPRFALAGDSLVLLENPLTGAEDYRTLLTSAESTAAAAGSGDYFLANGPKSSLFDRSATVRFVKSLTLDPAFEVFLDDDGLYDVGSEAYRISLAVLEQFVAEVEANGSVPIVMLMPRRDDLLNRQPGYAPLYDDLVRQSVRVIDLADAFAGVPVDDRAALFRPGDHYTAIANGLVAAHLRGVLDQILSMPG